MNGGIAQLAERLFCKQKAVGAHPTTSSFGGIVLIAAHRRRKAKVWVQLPISPPGWEVAVQCRRPRPIEV